MVASLSKRVNLGPGWQGVLSDELDKPYMQELVDFVANERRSKKIYPPQDDVFRAFLETPYDEVKVVIMGQDPYHGPGQAHGLCFSVQPGVPHPPSLRNIFKELQDDLDIPVPKTGCLLPWAKQGVLLLNATLTVEEGKPKSHFGKGWERFTDEVIRVLLPKKPVFVLWGSSARAKVENVIQHEHAEHVQVIVAPHPSPLSAHRGFFGSKPFSKLKELGIDWHLEPSG